jgi:dTDP-4-dehydrorhamnose reductase
MKVLVLGASGQIGYSLFQQISCLNVECIGTYSSYTDPDLMYLNITDYHTVQQYIKDFEPNIVFLPACVTNVDQCESQPDFTSSVNVLAVKNIVDTMTNIHTKLIYFSTDFVFDGNEGFYDENSQPNPINEYGRQKFCAEQYIVEHLKNYAIIRTSSVYGAEQQKKNFICRLLTGLQQNKVVTIPKDEQCTPSYNEDVADYAIHIAFNDDVGVYHAAGPHCINRYKFALETARIFDLDTNLIKPIISSDLTRPAKRPLNAGLSTIKHGYPPMKDWKNGLKEMKYLIKREEVL